MKKFAVIVAAGNGSRMGNIMPKQFLTILGKPVLWYTLQAFLEAYDDMKIVLVLPEAHLQKGQEILNRLDDPGRVRLTTGGKTRFQSVRNGLALIGHPSIVFVHDGVRCLVSRQLIRRCYLAAVETGNAVPAIPVADSVRLESPEGFASVSREKLRLIQTPQTFESRLLQAAFEQEYDSSFTDEASVVEKLGEKIHLVDGDPLNIKITTKTDLIIAQAALNEMANEK